LLPAHAASAPYFRHLHTPLSPAYAFAAAAIFAFYFRYDIFRYGHAAAATPLTPGYAALIDTVITLSFAFHYARFSCFHFFRGAFRFRFSYYTSPGSDDVVPFSRQVRRRRHVIPRCCRLSFADVAD